MPDAAAVRLSPDQALDEGLAALFRRLQAEPAPQVLLNLVERLEAAYRSGTIDGELRSIN